VVAGAVQAVGRAELGADRRRDPGAKHAEFEDRVVRVRAGGWQHAVGPQRRVAAVDGVHGVGPEHRADAAERVCGVDTRALPLQDRGRDHGLHLIVERAVARQVRAVARAEVGAAQPRGDALECGLRVGEDAQVQRSGDAEWRGSMSIWMSRLRSGSPQ